MACLNASPPFGDADFTKIFVTLNTERSSQIRFGRASVEKGECSGASVRCKYLSVLMLRQVEH